MKICKTCGLEKPLEEFHKNKGFQDGRHLHCSNCRNTWKRNYDAVWRLKHPGYQAAATFKWKYGLTLNDVSTMRNSQNNRCAICREEFTETPRIDHDHSSNRVRGLLCDRCNKGLGFFMDDPNRLRSAIEYIMS